MHNIRFWFAHGSCSLATHTLLCESELPFEAIEISVHKQETQSEAFAKINAKKRVPVLALDNEVITETPAIALAISQLVPEKGLLGVSQTEQARVMEWMCWLSGELHGQAFGGLLRPERFTHHPEQFEAIQLKSRERISDAFKTIETKLGNNFAVGKSLTVVDPYLLVFFNWGKGLNFNMEGNYPHYSAFSQSIANHPSVVKAMHR